MEKNILLTLTGRQRDDAGEELVTQMHTAAEAYEKNGSLYILYEEVPEEGSPVTKNIIKLKNSVLELTKRGMVNSRMIFEPGTEHASDYVTPFGCLKMDIATDRVETVSGPGRFEIQAEYTLSAGGSPISHCTLTLLGETIS